MKKACGSAGYAGCLAIALAIFALALNASAQKQKKNQNSGNDSATAAPLLPNSIPDEIDHDIGEMLGAFQVGDADAMHKYYADNVTFVSGAYEPPVMGWSNYLTVYQRERTAFQGMQLQRRNTFIFHNGDVAWASYQWEFEAQLNGQPYNARGQTTLVFNKVNGNWMIVHNHTSEICPVNTPVISQSPQRAPAPTFVPDQR